MQDQASDYKTAMGKALFLVTFLLALTLLCTVFDTPWIIRNDCAMYLRCAQLIMQGKVPYVDFCDINPPLIMYVMTIPVAIGQITHLGSIIAFDIFIFSIITVATLALKNLLDQYKEHADSRHFSIILIGYALTNFLAAQWHEYGQRDHLFAILLLPFFFLRWARWNGLKVTDRQAFTWGLLLSLPVCLRPFNLFILAAPELYWLIAKKRWRPFIAPEAIAACCGSLIYLFFLFAVFPAEGRIAWLKHIIPIVVRGYESYDQPLTVLLLLVAMYGVLPCWLLGFISAFKKKTVSLTVPLLVQGLAAILLYLIEFKPWANHLLPALSLCATVALIQMQLLCSKNGQIKSKETLISLALIITLLLPYPLILAIFQQFSLNAQKDLILKETKKSDSVMVLSPILPNAYPTILQTGRADGGRYFFLFPISMIDYARSKNPSAADRVIFDAEENRFLLQLQEDLHTKKPALIMIDNEPKNLSSRRSIVDYLDEKNILADLLKDYERVGLCKAASELVVYKRKTKD